MAQELQFTLLMFRIQAELWFPEISARKFENPLQATALEGIAARID
jgi:hypothetical protein